MSGLELIRAMVDGRDDPMRGSGHGTIDLDVKLLKAVPLDQELIAEGKVTHVSRTLGVSEGALKDAGGARLAHATSTCAIPGRG
jgi:uncharacterized protein (TIGR00369 family)